MNGGILLLLFVLGFMATIAFDVSCRVQFMEGPEKLPPFLRQYYKKKVSRRM
jgi:hypothetical protein